MMRSLCAIAIAISLTLAGFERQSGAQPSTATQTSTAVLAEAEQLNQKVMKLYGEGKFREAMAAAERALALREQALGLTDPEVAKSLNNLAALHQSQGAYAKAEPLLLRALRISEQALGPTHPNVAAILNNLAEIYLTAGAHDKAVPLLVRALNINETTFGAANPEFATRLNRLAQLYLDHGAYDKAEPLLVRALKVKETTLGSTHPDVATSLNNLARLYQAQSAYAKAEPLFVRALNITENGFGPLHPAVAASLNNLATVFLDQGAIDRAEPLFARALSITEKALGPTHRDVATGINNLGVLYQARGAYSKAEPLLLRALDLREKAFGSTHTEVAATVNNLAMLYRNQGAYSKAEPLLVRALAIYEKALGPTHLDVATSLNNLAGLYRSQGKYGMAESLFVRALHINEKGVGVAHPVVATSLNNLATLYQDQGAYEKAEPFLLRALAIRERALGPTHPDVAESLLNLGSLFEDEGAYVKATPLLVRALAIHEKMLGPLHPDVARSLNSLAAIYLGQGAYDKAEPLLIRALALREQVLGDRHTDVAASLNNLAMLYQAQGAFSKAGALYDRARRTNEQALGPTHPDVATNLDNLARLYSAQRLYAQAEPLFARAAEIHEQQLRTELAQLSEPRKRALIVLMQGEADELVSLHADAMPVSAQALELAFTTVLRRKGRILDSLVDNQTALRAHLNPALRAQLTELSAARAELSARLYAPLGLGGVVDREATRVARAHIDELESTLSAASTEFRVHSDPVTLAKIQAALPPGATLVEFVRYHRYDARQPQHWQEDRYVAYLLTAHTSARWVALGAAAPIDAQVDAVLTAMNPKVKVSTGASQAALRRLDALVFAPLRPQLAGVSHLILAPDGKLNIVPFEALVDAEGRYALERYLLSYVTTGRDLLRLAVHRTARSASVIIADPDYGPVPTERNTTAVSFVPLAGALAEATDLQRYFSTTPLTGSDATKAALAALLGPAMLHVATHGFYARDPGASPIASYPSMLKSSGAPRPAPPKASSAPLAPRQVARGMFVDGGASLLLPSARADDPTNGLDRAGLAMAGANQSAAGIVTARELAGFDWWGTQLVVLSACETGIGALPSGDGVYGMRRALVLAGAASQVVSLWSVSDSSTRDLMRDYYAELAHGTGRAEALRQAKLRLMRQPRYAHPYYWAGFIPAGDWRPLDKAVTSSRKPQR